MTFEQIMDWLATEPSDAEYDRIASEMSLEELRDLEIAIIAQDTLLIMPNPLTRT